jgi:hypothetical protein
MRVYGISHVSYSIECLCDPYETSRFYVVITIMKIPHRQSID